MRDLLSSLHYIFDLWRSITRVNGKFVAKDLGALCVVYAISNTPMRRSVV